MTIKIIWYSICQDYSRVLLLDKSTTLAECEKEVNAIFLINISAQAGLNSVKCPLAFVWTIVARYLQYCSESYILMIERSFWIIIEVFRIWFGSCTRARGCRNVIWHTFKCWRNGFSYLWSNLSGRFQTVKRKVRSYFILHFYTFRAFVHARFDFRMGTKHHWESNSHHSVCSNIATLFYRT